MNTKLIITLFAVLAFSGCIDEEDEPFVISDPDDGDEPVAPPVTTNDTDPDDIVDNDTIDDDDDEQVHGFGPAKLNVNPHIASFDAPLKVTVDVQDWQQWSATGDFTLSGTGPGTFDVQKPSGVYEVTFTSEHLNVTKQFIVEGRPVQFGEPGDQDIRPGAASSVCTTNVLMTYHHLRYFIATAAHCVDELAPDDEQYARAPCAGITSDSVLSPIGSKDNIRGTNTELTLVYSAWQTMMDVQEQDRDACNGNDFALYEISRNEWDNMHPATHQIGGPTCLHESGNEFPGDTLWGMGHSSLYFENEELFPKRGAWIQELYGDYQHRVYLLPQGIPGDSGGPLFDDAGCIMGVASTIGYAGGYNAYTNMDVALQYMEDNVGWAPTVVTWDEWTPHLPA